MQKSKSLTQEIMNLERQYWTAMSEHDLETALKLTDFPCLVAGAHGLHWVDEEQFKKMFNSSRDSVRTFEFEDKEAEVHQVGPDTAVVAYKVHTTLSKNGLSKRVKAVDTSTWIKRGNKWVCAMHTETELSQ